MKTLPFTVPANPKETKAIAEYHKTLKAGNYVIEISRNFPARSISHNKYYRAFLKVCAIVTGEYDEDQLHEFFKVKFNGEWITTKGGDLLIGRSTAGMDSKQFSGYLALCKRFAFDEWGVSMPEKKDVDYRRYMEISNSYKETFRD